MAINKYTEQEVSDCILLDEKLRKSIIIVSDLQTKKASGRFSAMDSLLLNQEIELKNKREMEFSKSSCANKIEYKRLVETGKIDQDWAVRSEEEVLSKNNNEQYIYIGIGAVVLITSLYLILKK